MELSDFDKQCISLLESFPNRHSKHCFRSAIRHIELGAILYPTDKSMGVFRYITAEEEAASGLIRCLQENGYANANTLNPKRHEHKHSVIPFFSVISQFIEDRFREFDISIELGFFEDTQPQRVGIQVKVGGVTFLPDPPLNFSLNHQGQRFSYRPQIDAYARAQGVSKVTRHIEKSSNLRNQLLYAAPQGLPGPVEVEERFFLAHQQKVLSMLRVYLMVAPYEEHLPFVQDSLDALLSMIGLLNFNDLHTEV